MFGYPECSGMPCKVDEVLDCIENGLFAKSTIKPLSNVFGLEDEIKRTKAYLRAGEWFLVSGLRRTGKTTLIRSVAASLDEHRVMYVNTWKIHPDQAKLEKFIEIMGEQLQVAATKFIDRVNITDFKLLGMTVKFEKKKKIFDQLFDQLLEDRPLIWIIDEVQDFFKDPRLFRYLAALHDLHAPRLTVVLLGSVVAMRKILRITASHPLYGRISDEFLLTPFNEMKSRQFLKQGFEQCNISIPEEVITEAALQLGGFAGWLSLFGRLAVIEKEMLSSGGVEGFKQILQRLEKEARHQIIDEIARMLHDKRKAGIYLKILRKVAEEPSVTLAELSKSIEKKPTTLLNYLSYLQAHGIIKKMERHYLIADPLTRRVLRHPNVEQEIKKKI